MDEAALPDVAALSSQKDEASPLQEGSQQLDEDALKDNACEQQDCHF